MQFNATDHATFTGIAEGNPDEDKIGAFGVGAFQWSINVGITWQHNSGFYSVFSVTDTPFVASGRKSPYICATEQDADTN